MLLSPAQCESFREECSRKEKSFLQSERELNGFFSKLKKRPDHRGNTISSAEHYFEVL